MVLHAVATIVAGSSWMRLTGSWSFNWLQRPVAHRTGAAEADSLDVDCAALRAEEDIHVSSMYRGAANRFI